MIWIWSIWLPTFCYSVWTITQHALCNWHYSMLFSNMYRWMTPPVSLGVVSSHSTSGSRVYLKTQSVLLCLKLGTCLLENLCILAEKMSAWCTIVRYGPCAVTWVDWLIENFYLLSHMQITPHSPDARSFPVNCSILHRTLRSCVPSLTREQIRLANCCSFCSGWYIHGNVCSHFWSCTTPTCMHVLLTPPAGCAWLTYLRKCKHNTLTHSPTLYIGFFHQYVINSTHNKLIFASVYDHAELFS